MSDRVGDGTNIYQPWFRWRIGMMDIIGEYPEGKDFDMNYGNPGERPATDNNIAGVPIPQYDPVLGFGEGIATLWKDHLPAEQESGR